MGAWNFYSEVLEYAEFDGVIFIEISWSLQRGGGNPTNLKVRETFE
jgi:hypothetical protein